MRIGETASISLRITKMVKVSEVKTVVVTVHGIRTFGQWQERLEALVREARPDVAFEHYHYGYFSILSFLLPPIRALTTRAFRAKLERIFEHHGNARYVLIGHSFGTHLIGWALQQMFR